MREIKYRAFLKSNKLMYNVLNIDISNEKALIENKEKHLKGYVKYPKEVELMQYTGLKDKNGTKIYEGDIVKMNFEYKNHFFEELDDLDEDVQVCTFDGLGFIYGQDNLKDVFSSAQLQIKTNLISKTRQTYDNYYDMFVEEINKEIEELQAKSRIIKSMIKKLKGVRND